LEFSDVFEPDIAVKYKTRLSAISVESAEFCNILNADIYRKVQKNEKNAKLKYFISYYGFRF
jgi:hypothetical protein